MKLRQLKLVLLAAIGLGGAAIVDNVVGHRGSTIDLVGGSVVVLSAAFLLVPVVLGTRERNELSKAIRGELGAIPQIRPNQHLVDVTLADGRVVENVWVAYGQYLRPSLVARKRFRASDVVSIELAKKLSRRTEGGTTSTTTP